MSRTVASAIEPSSTDQREQPPMTVGQLSDRTGLPRKAIREFEGRGLIHTIGRSEANYRLFDESALWCIRAIRELRGLGLTLAQIEELRARHGADPERPFEVQFDEILGDVRARLTGRIEELRATVARIDAFRDAAAGDLAAGSRWRHDPCLRR